MAEVKDDIQIAIDKAINEHMPGMVGNQLRQLLVQAEKDKKEVNKLKEEKEELEKELKKLQNLSSQLSSISSREREITGREQKVALQEAEQKIHMAYFTGDRNFVKDIIKTIFQDRQAVYGFTGNLNTYHPGGSTSGNIMATVTKTDNT